MPKFLVRTVLAIVALAGAPAPVAAQSGEPYVANRAGATLLLPYFEVDLDNPSGTTTLFAINNSSATAMLSHVTVWSDLGVPVFAFNVYLTGYDIQTINLRDVFTGTVPRTASAGQDPADTISDQGPLSQDINFASCNGQLPPPAVPASLQTHLRAALSGSGSEYLGGLCASRPTGTPHVLRGYVTVDTVNNCTLRFPGDPGYFVPGGIGDATNQNTLYGDWQLIDPSRGLAIGDALVTVRANALDPDTSTPGNYTFYGRLVNFSAADNREPLSTTFAARFVAAKEYKGEDTALLQQLLPPATELIVWRDTKSSAAPFACNAAPGWYPLGQTFIAAMDEQENAQVVLSPSPFGAATQRVVVGSSALPLTPESGWLFMNLSTEPPTQVPGLSKAFAAQAWVSVIHRVYQGPTGGRYDAGFRAIRLDTARRPIDQVFPPF